MDDTVTEYIQVRTRTRRHPESREDTALLEDARWYGRLFRFPDLYDNEDDEEREGERKECNDPSLGPLLVVRSDA